MKTVMRVGVFETNSSSVHTMTLKSRDDIAADGKEEKPKLAKHVKLADKKDKLYMACGCCKELYDDYDQAEDADAYDFATLMQHADDPGFYYNDCKDDNDVKYGVAIALLVGIYCELTGEDEKTLKAAILKENSSGRACHTRFFEEGALYSAESDYYIIDDLFWGSSLPAVVKHIRNYFDDDNVLCYREYWNGMGMFDDD